MAMPPTKPRDFEARLDYHAAPINKRRRAIWRAILLCAGLALVWIGTRYYQPVKRQVALRSMVRACLNWRPPSKSVIYEEEPTAARALRADTRSYVKFWDGAAMRVAPLRSLGTSIGVFDGWDPFLYQTLYCGSRTRIVAIYQITETKNDAFRYKTLQSLVIDPGTWRGSSTIVSRGQVKDLVIPRPGQLRIFAGQADDSNPCQAIYDYQFGGAMGQIRLTLLSDDRVTLVAESGPLAKAAARDAGVK